MVNWATYGAQTVNMQVARMYRSRCPARFELHFEETTRQTIQALWKDTEEGVGEKEEERCGKLTNSKNESEKSADPVSMHLEAVLTCFELFLSFIFS